MVCIVFAAFLLEAYLNHIGDALFPNWAASGAWDPPKKKLAAICKKLGFAPDLGKKPFQSFSTVFKYRDALAHGKTINVAYSALMPASGYPGSGAKAKWQKDATTANAEALLRDAEKIVREIHKHTSGAKHDPFAVASHGFYAVED